MKFNARLDTSALEKDLKRLQSRATVQDIAEGVKGAAEYIISQAQKRAPRDFGDLANSEFVEEPKRRGNQHGSNISIEYGFNAEHASVMDLGWKIKIIRPKNAKMLFIPLTRRARRRGSKGGSLSKGGLQLGKDFVFAKSVKVPAAQEGGHVGRDGEQKGPNFFFSGAQKRALRSGKVAELITRFADRAIAKRVGR